MDHKKFNTWIQQQKTERTAETHSSELMSRKQAASYLGVKEQTLACWATTKRYDLPYVKIGRLVKYKREDLECFILENRFTNEARYV